MVGPAAQYSHPIDHLFTGLLPAAAGYLILSQFVTIHYSTVLIWVSFRVVHSFISHCGYYFRFDPAHIAPFLVGSHFHSFHHSGNCGNFSSELLIWDVVFGTIQPYVDELNREIKLETKKT